MSNRRVLTNVLRRMRRPIGTFSSVGRSATYDLIMEKGLSLRRQARRQNTRAGRKARGKGQGR